MDRVGEKLKKRFTTAMIIILSMPTLKMNSVRYRAHLLYATMIIQTISALMTSLEITLLHWLTAFLLSLSLHRHLLLVPVVLYKISRMALHRL